MALSRALHVAVPRPASTRQGLGVWAPPAVLILTLVGVTASAVRYALWQRAPAFVIADSDNYFLPGWQLGQWIGFDLELRRTPVYPAFVGLIVNRFGQELSALTLAQHVLGAGTCVLAAGLALRLFGPWTAFLVGLLTAAASPLLVVGQYVMAEALFIPLSLLTLTQLCGALVSRRDVPMLLGGILIGLTTLTRPIGLVILAALGLALVIQERHPRRVFPRLLPALAGVALLVVPWMARNAFVHGSFSPEGNPGQTLVGRTMRHDRGFAFENPTDPDPARQRARAIMRDGRGSFVSPVRERIKRELGVSDADANRLMRDLAAEAIVRQPEYFLRGTLVNFAQLAQGISERPRDHWATRREARYREEWEAHPEIRHLLGPPTPAQEQHYPEVETLLTLYQPARLGPVLPLLALVGLLALLRGPRRVTGALVGFTLIGLLLASVALVAPLPRYGYPVEPLMAIFAAGGLALLIVKVRATFWDTANATFHLSKR